MSFQARATGLGVRDYVISIRYSLEPEVFAHIHIGMKASEAKRFHDFEISFAFTSQRVYIGTYLVYHSSNRLKKLRFQARLRDFRY